MQPTDPLSFQDRAVEKNTVFTREVKLPRFIIFL